MIRGPKWVEFRVKIGLMRRIQLAIERVNPFVESHLQQRVKRFRSTAVIHFVFRNVPFR